MAEELGRIDTADEELEPTTAEELGLIVVLDALAGGLEEGKADDGTAGTNEDDETTEEVLGVGLGVDVVQLCDGTGS
jgi:hypothetical protein